MQELFCLLLDYLNHWINIYKYLGTKILNLTLTEFYSTVQGKVRSSCLSGIGRPLVENINLVPQTQDKIQSKACKKQQSYVTKRVFAVSNWIAQLWDYPQTDLFTNQTIRQASDSKRPTPLTRQSTG